MGRAYFERRALAAAGMQNLEKYQVASEKYSRNTKHHDEISSEPLEFDRSIAFKKKMLASLFSIGRENPRWRTR